MILRVWRWARWYGGAGTHALGGSIAEDTGAGKGGRDWMGRLRRASGGGGAWLGEDGAAHIIGAAGDLTARRLDNPAPHTRRASEREAGDEIVREVQHIGRQHR